MIIINSKQLLSNLETILAYKNKDTKLSVVLKYDAFGFGIDNIVKLFDSYPIHSYGFSENSEAVAIKKLSNKPIHRLRPATYQEILDCLELNIQELVGSIDELNIIDKINKEKNISVPVWINIDSNLHRDGFIEIDNIIPLLQKYKINVIGIRTHTNYKLDNLDIFMNDFYTKASKIKSLYPNAIISASSSFIFLNKNLQQKYNYDMVAIGSGIFSRTARSLIELKHLDNMKSLYLFESNVLQIRKLPPNTNIGYGSEYITNKEELIGTINLGWFNGPGFISCVQKEEYILINNKPYKIIASSGNVMNVLLDETVKVGDKVIYKPKGDYFNDILNCKLNEKKLV